MLSAKKNNVSKEEEKGVNENGKRQKGTCSIDKRDATKQKRRKKGDSRSVSSLVERRDRKSHYDNTNFVTSDNINAQVEDTTDFVTSDNINAQVEDTTDFVTSDNTNAQVEDTTEFVLDCSFDGYLKTKTSPPSITFTTCIDKYLTKEPLFNKSLLSLNVKNALNKCISGAKKKHVFESM